MKLREKLEILKAMGWSLDDVIELVDAMEQFADRVPETVDKERFTAKDVRVSKGQIEKKPDERTIKEMLRKLGIPVHIKGYQYTADAIKICIEDKESISSVTKTIYPTVAGMNKTTSSRVERAIRHAIEVAWSKGDLEYQDILFKYTVSRDKGKPTNSEFIAMIADYIVMNSK